MPTQLSIDSLLSTEPDFGPKRPRVDGMQVPFDEWMSVAELLRFPSPDFWYRVPSWADWESKRMARWYESFVADIAERGFLDPIFLFAPHTMTGVDNKTPQIGNGHHRLIAAYDLGYTEVPVTYDSALRFRLSGMRSTGVLTH